MPRVNRDANKSRLHQKYGVPLPAYRREERSKPTMVNKTVVVTPKAPESHWLKTHREFLRWKKTDDYKQWRKIQFAKQNGLCYYCDVSLRFIRTNIEHITPKSRGGTNKKKNLVLACWKCNKVKNTTILSKKKRRELKEKHLSKTRAFQEQISIDFELASRFQE